MLISTDSTVQDLKDKIQFKEEEISFFASKIIAADSSSDATKTVISAVDTSILDDIEAVNSKLRDVKTAYQDRVDSGCKSQLFWRIISREVISSGTNLQYKFTLECTKLKQNYKKIYFGRTEPYTDYEKGYYKTLNLPLPPLDDGLTVYYVSDSVIPMEIPEYSSTSILSTPSSGISSLPGTPGISSFRADDDPTYGTLSDNLYGLKYYDSPYTRDIGNTFVCSFTGKISAGSTILTALADATSYGGITDLEVGQILSSDKDGVFSTGYNTIVGIATTPGNTDPNNVASAATATASVNSSYQLSGVTILGGGSGFTTTPSVTISAPNAITAIGTANVSSAGSITSATIINPGTGYTQAPLVFFSTPGIYLAEGIGYTGASGIITSAVVTNSGYGYTIAPTITFDDPPVIGVGIGSTALGVSFISTSSGGIVTGISVTFAGLGYTTSPTVYFSTPGIHTAVGIATLGTGASAGIVTGIIIGTGLTNTGFGYTSNLPITVTLSDPLKTQAVGVANVSSASTVSSITLTDVGAGYTSAPTIAIEDPSLEIISLITLQNPAVIDAYAPEADGTLVSFTASSSASEVVSLLKLDSKKLSVKFNKGTFSPQTIGIMTYGSVGIGVSIKYDNSGRNSGTQSWKPEYAHERIVIKGGKDIPAIKEPSVGAGKIYYRDGLDFYPISTPGNSNSDASEGDTIEVYVNANGSSLFSVPGIYTTLADFISQCPSCSSTVTNNLNSAIAVADTAKLNIASGIGTLNAKIDAANQFRTQKNDTQLQIWGYRTMLGQLIDEKTKYENILKLFDDPTISNIFS